jgi:ABC-type Zn uptake system ZnuABC Zn-binding protein ZnuA
MRSGGTFDVDVKLLQIKEDEKLTQDPDFWNDAKKAEQVMRQIRNKFINYINKNFCVTKE